MKNKTALMACVLASLITASATTYSSAFAAKAEGRSSINAQRVGIAATVNSDVITFSDLANRTKLYTSGSREAPTADAIKKVSTQVLSRLIDEKLQLQEASQLGITIPDEQVMEGFAEIAKQNGLPPDEFRKRMTASGVKVDTLYDQIRAELAWSQVVRRKLRPQINISESDIDTEVSQISRTSGKPEFQVAEIFLAVKSPADDSTVRQNAERIALQISKGASFAKIAREVSQSPGASTGGDIGWITQGQLAAPLDAALTQMQAGQLSPPIRTDVGYHLLFLRNVRQRNIANSTGEAPTPAAAVATPDAVPTEVLSALHLKQILIPVAADEPLAVVNAKVSRAEALKREVISCDAMDAKMADFASIGTGDLGKVNLADMPDALRQTVEGLQDNVISTPLRTQDGLVVVMICGRETVPGIAPAPATVQAPEQTAEPMSTDEVNRDEIASKLGLQRLTQMQERYLRDLRASAFIDKRL